MSSSVRYGALRTLQGVAVRAAHTAAFRQQCGDRGSLLRALGKRAEAPVAQGCKQTRNDAESWPRGLARGPGRAFFSNHTGYQDAYRQQRASEVAAAEEKEMLLLRKLRLELTRPVSQATGHTHPHLLDIDQVTPGIPLAEYRARRQALAALMPPHSLLILPAAPEQFYSMDVPHRYRQHTDFLYFTGCLEPQAALVVYKPRSAAVDASAIEPGPQPDALQAEFLLFVRARDASRELWDGPMIGIEDAPAMFGIPNVYPVERLGALVAEIMHAGEPTPPSLFFDANVNSEFTKRVGTALAPDKSMESAAGAAWQSFASRLCSPVPLTQPLRLFKSPNELALMRRAAAVTADAFIDAMQRTSAGLGEWQIAARMAYTMGFRGGPSARLAFPMVVASGPRACTLHYTENAALLQKHHMLMVDAGVELHGYCSDVSRSWPVDGRFRGAAKALYDMLLSIHEACLKLAREQTHPSHTAGDVAGECRAPAASLEHLHRVCVRMIAENLYELGFFGRRHRVDEIIERGLYGRYFPHALGHYLGMDTHDTHQLSKAIPFRAGMVITVEPGVYVPVADGDAPAAFRGLGMRIEDDVVIRPGGAAPEILSAGIPLQARDIEAVMREVATTSAHY